MSSTSFKTSDIAAMVREVTDDEVAFYLEHGWVMLRGLVAPELIATLRRIGEQRYDERETRDEWWHNLAMQPDAQPYGAFVLSTVMGRNAQRLINRKRLSDLDIPIRYREDDFVYKPPSPPDATTRKRDWHLAFGWHQDSTEHGTDRVGEMKFWVALNDITVEQGPMKFIDRSHRDGPLGVLANDFNGGSEESRRDLLDIYPRLVERMTPPMEYNAGDATAHDGYTAHGSLPNTSDRPRLSLIIEYTPADTRCWEGQLIENQGSKRILPDDETFPIFYR